MKTWEMFLPEVMPYVPGCPEIMAVNAIRNAAIEFCEFSRVWQAAFDAISLIVNEPEYDLQPPSGSLVVTVVQAAISGSDINGPFSDDELDRATPSWDDDTSDSPSYFQVKENAIRLVPIPSKVISNGLTGRMALKPAQDSFEGPDLLYNDWKEGIAHGAKHRLMVVPGNKWSNEKQAVYEFQMFRRHMNRAFRKALTGGRLGSMTVHPRSFV